MEKKRNRRPLSPFRLPGMSEDGLGTLKKMYKTDEWNGEKGFRSILNKAYILYKEENPEAELPDTFAEVLKMDPEELAAKSILLSVITKANEVLDDTIHAQATLDFADGKKPKEEPRLLYDVEKVNFGRTNKGEPKTISDKAIRNAMKTDFFTKPEQSFKEWEAKAKTTEERQQIRELRKELTYLAFQRIAHDVAEETGEDEAQLLDPERRTLEQEKKLVEGIRKEIAANKENIYNSLLLRVIHLLYGRSEPSKLRRDSARTVINFAVGYFFAKHPELDYKADVELEAEQAQEALDVYARMIDAVERRDKNVKITTAIRSFIEADTQGEEERELILQCVEETVDETMKYRPILQNKATNTRAHVSKRMIEPNKYSNDAEIVKDGVRLIFNNFQDLNLSLPTTKVLDTFVFSLTRVLPYNKELVEGSVDKNREIELSVEEYMETCGLKDAKEARNQLNRSTNDIYNESVDYTEERWVWKNGKKKKETIHWHSRILDATGVDLSKPLVQNGKVKVKFAYDIAKMLLYGQLMPYPLALLKVNAKYNPHSYYIGRKMAEHHNMNYWKSNANVISVKSLVEACPDLPNYDEVMAKDKHAKQRIIDPFERDLINLKQMGILASWNYCNRQDQPITQEQVEKYDYATWISWLVKFELADYPERQREELEAAKKTGGQTHRKKSGGKSGGNRAPNGG